MKVLVQYPEPGSAPCGVWWYDVDDRLRRFYPEPSVNEILAAGLLGQKEPNVSWDDMFAEMAQRMPRSVDYEVFDTQLSPEAFLSSLR